VAENPDVVSALAEVLVRRCVGRVVPGDGELARTLARGLENDTEAIELFAVGAVGAWAGFGPDGQLDHGTINRVVELCRGLLRAELPVEARALVCAALGLIAARGTTSQPAVDFVNVGTVARAAEQHELALWAARRALDSPQALSQSHRTLALLTVAVISRDPAVVAEAYAAASGLEPGDIAARAARTLEPTLRDSGGLSAVGEAVRARNRRSAAGSLLPVFEDLRRSADEELLSGLYEAFAAMAAPALDVERARRGLTGVVGHLRGRQRFGEVPPVARAGVDMAADLLALDADPAAANVLTEFVEALADAGLSEVTAIPAEGVPAVVQARLAYLAQKSPIWTDLAACVTGLRGRSALLMRQQRSLSTGSPTFLVLFVAPPDGLAVKSVHLDGPQSDTLENLTTAMPAALSRVDAAELQRLAAEFLPRSLVERAVGGELASLVVVPDGAAWTVPWQAAAVLVGTDVTLAPSLGVHARIPADPPIVESITAVIDEDAPYAEVVEDALLDVRARGFDVRMPRSLGAAPGGDLLLTFTHGSGTGLGFTAGSAERRLPALVLAASRFRSVLAAACWSSAAPPTAYPLNLPAALLLNGASTVVGGLWPLPAADTAAVVAAVVRDIADGTGLRAAIRRARAQAPETVMSRWGLAVHGGPGSP
jgi:hypothetical protein